MYISVLLNNNVLHIDVPAWCEIPPGNLQDSRKGYAVPIPTNNSWRCFVVNIYNANGSSLHLVVYVDGGPQSHSHLAVFMCQPLTVSAFSKPLNVCSLIVSNFYQPYTRTPLFQYLESALVSGRIQIQNLSSMQTRIQALPSHLKFNFTFFLSSFS